jgi:beta-lactamase regulating signal transducer with metallopeptidase domain/biopolymer transport protein ExbD
MIELINHWGSLWAGYFGFAVLQNTVFLGLVFVLLHLLRHRSAYLLYMLCMIGLLKLLLPPFVPLRLAPSSVPGPSVLSDVTSLIVPVSAPAATGTAAGTGIGFGLPGALLVAWAAFMVSYLLLVGISTARLRRRLACSARVGSIAVRPGSGGRTVGIFRSDRIAMPLTLGLLSRSIFVPPAWDGWTDRCREMVVRHEMAHIRRLDGLVQIFQVVAQAAYFFNPLVWVLNRRMNQYREMACDDEAVGGPEGDSVEYSKYLVDIAVKSVRDSVLRGPATALVVPGNGLLNRIRYQLEEGKMKLTTARQRTIILAVLFALMLPLSLYCSRAGGEIETGTSKRVVLAEKPQVVRRVEILVEDEKGIAVDGIATTIEGLGETLDEVVGDGEEDIVILLSAGSGLRMDVIMEVRDVLVGRGLNKVIFAGGVVTGLPLVLPSDEHLEKLAEVPEHDVAFVIVLPGGEVILEGDRMNISDLKAALEKRLAENDKLIVHIHTVGGTFYPDFFKTLGVAKGAGATRISFD